MKKQGHAHLVNLSSSASHTVYTASGVHRATKFAVIAISEALRQGNERGTSAS
jgi:NADP-dependent 3-hydroxy acid dehydrogenase YdfG